MAVELPRELRAFFAERALELDGRIWDGAPAGSAGGRVETPPAPSRRADRVALCDAGSETLTVDWAAPHAVRRSDGVRVAPSLERFEASLLPKLSQISPSIDRARALLRARRHPEAAALFETALRVFELGHRHDAVWVSIDRNLQLGAVYNDLGICQRRLGDARRAEALWRTGIQLVGDPPQLRKNLADLLLEEERFAEVAAVALPRSVLSDPCDRAYVLAARAVASDRLGRPEERDANLTAIAQRPEGLDDLTRELLASHGLSLPDGSQR